MWHDVCVGVHGLVYAGVAEDLLEDLHWLVGFHPQRGEGVPQGVKPRPFGQARLLSKRLDGVVPGRLGRGSMRVRKDIVTTGR